MLSKVLYTEEGEMGALLLQGEGRGAISQALTITQIVKKPLTLEGETPVTPKYTRALRAKRSGVGLNCVERGGPPDSLGPHKFCSWKGSQEVAWSLLPCEISIAISRDPLAGLIAQLVKNVVVLLHL